MSGAQVNSAMDKFRAFGAQASASINPFLTRTQQFIKEQTGNAADKTELPPDYLELEARVDALKQTHQTLLAATSQYANEAYDYPPNMRESFQDLGKTISEKVTLLSSAGSAAEAQHALTAPSSAKPQPKTFNHAIARASLAGSQQLSQTPNSSSNAPDPLAQGLEKYALAQEQVGAARLTQDAQIQQRFLAGWSTTLNTNLKAADRARAAVGSARLSLDAAKTKAAAGGRYEEAFTEPQRRAVEHAEDAFVDKVDAATVVMRNVLDTPEPLRNLVELARAQAAFHARAAEVLEEVSTAVGELQVEQEASYRQSRDGQ